MQELISSIGYGLCHQLPSRTFIAGGFSYPVCARCTGIYFGLVSALLVLVLLYHKRADAGLFPKPVLVVLGCLILPMALDGGTSYLGLRETCNAIRFLTGSGAGAALGALLFWVLRTFSAVRDESRCLLARPRDLGLWLATELLFTLVFLFCYSLFGLVGAVFIALCIVGTITFINAVVLSFVKPFRNPAASKARLVALCLVAVCAACLELAGLGLLKSQLVPLLLG